MMNTTLLIEEALKGNFPHGLLTRKMVRERAVKLSLIHSHSDQETSKSDWEETKRELTRKPEIDPKEDLLESSHESKQWDPLPGSQGYQASVAASDDRESEERSMREMLVEKVIQEAKHNQMLQSVILQRQVDQ